MRRHLTWTLLALGCTLPGVARAAPQASDAKVGFTCTGPGGLHIEGKSTELSVAEKGEALLLTVPLANVTTGISLRDTHMKEKYLDVPTYPTAELLVPRAGLKFPAEGATVEASAPGTLTIHGTSKPVTVHYKATRTGKAYDVQGDVQVNMNDFGIATPSYLGISVKPPVDITVTFRFLET